jgi:6-phosphogluconolactonase
MDPRRACLAASALAVAGAGLVAGACDGSGDAQSSGAPANDAGIGDGGGSSGALPGTEGGAPGIVDAGGPTPADASPDAIGPTAHGRLVAFASGYGPNLFTFAVDPSTGDLSPLSMLASFGTAPSFLAPNPAMTFLYAVDENQAGRVGAYRIDADAGALSFLGAVSTEGSGPAFVGLDRTGRYVFAANYTDGSVTVFPVQADGSLGAPTDHQMAGGEAHMAITDPSNAYLFVPCKADDRVRRFTFDATTGKLGSDAAMTGSVMTAAGAGPRHLAFHPNGKWAYLINETSSTMTAYAYDAATGTMTPVGTQSTVPPSFHGTNTAAEVWVHPSGSWVVGSNRGADDLVVFAVDASTGALVSPTFTSAGGMAPRDFAFDPSGSWLYAADEDSGAVVPFRFDASMGTLAPLGHTVAVPQASYVGLGTLP